MNTDHSPCLLRLTNKINEKNQDSSIKELIVKN